MVSDSIYDSIFNTNTRTVTEYRFSQFNNDQRAWTLEYTEDVNIKSGSNEVNIFVNDHDLGPCPVTHRNVGTVDVIEHGFFPGSDVYRVRQQLDDQGNVKRVIRETYLRTERRGPTRWIGHRVITPNIPPLTVTWIQDGRFVRSESLVISPDPFTLKSPPPEADAVLVEALNQLTWNRDITDPTVPDHAHGVRTLHWAERADAEAIAE